MMSLKGIKGNNFLQEDSISDEFYDFKVNLLFPKISNHTYPFRPIK